MDYKMVDFIKSFNTNKIIMEEDQNTQTETEEKRLERIAKEQTEAIGKLMNVDAELAVVQAMLEEWGEPADKQCFEGVRQKLNTLYHRLKDTSRPR